MNEESIISRKAIIDVSIIAAAAAADSRPPPITPKSAISCSVPSDGFSIVSASISISAMRTAEIIPAASETVGQSITPPVLYVINTEPAQSRITFTGKTRPPLFMGNNSADSRNAAK